MSTCGAGSSPGFSRTFERNSSIALRLFHSTPESSSAIDTSGRPRVSSKAVWIGVPAAMHDPVPEGIVAFASTRLMPVTPQSSSIWELFWVTAAYSVGLLVIEGGVAGVAAYFQASPPMLSGTSPGASFQLAGSARLPVPR